MEREPKKEEGEAIQAFVDLKKILLRSEDESGDRVLNLNKTARWVEGKKTKKYTVMEQELLVDKLREAVKKMRELLPFLIPDRMEETAAALSKADIYLAGHNENIEKRERGIKALVTPKSLTDEELKEIAKKEGIVPGNRGWLKIRLEGEEEKK